MSKDKQIEEMARDICASRVGASLCENCDMEGCLYREIAIALTAKGYRKSTDLAEEIFAEIKRTLDTVIWTQDLEIKTNRAVGFNSDAEKFAVRKKAFEDAKDYLRIVEKKYTEGGK